MSIATLLQNTNFGIQNSSEAVFTSPATRSLNMADFQITNSKEVSSTNMSVSNLTPLVIDGEINVQGNMNLNNKSLLNVNEINGQPYNAGLSFEGTVANYNLLPPQPQPSGDAWVTADTGDLWVSNGTAWSNTGSLVTGVLTDGDIGVSVEAFDATILKNADIGVNVEAFDNTILKEADINTLVEAYDPAILKSGDIGVSVQAYDATILKSADIGVSVEARDATILKNANIGVSVEAYDATILKSADIGVSVEARDATILKNADIGVNVEAYDATILKSADIGVSVEARDATILKNADIGVNVEAYDATILKSADIGSSVQAYDATILKSADIGSSVAPVSNPSFTGTVGAQVLQTNDIVGNDNLRLRTISNQNISLEPQGTGVITMLFSKIELGTGPSNALPPVGAVSGTIYRDVANALHVTA